METIQLAALGAIIGLAWAGIVTVCFLILMQTMDHFGLYWPPHWWVRWRYPHEVFVDFEMSMSHEPDKWIAANRIAARQDGFRWRFARKEDAAMFKLRWL